MTEQFNGLRTIDKPEQPTKCSSAIKDENTPITEPKTKDKNSNNAEQCLEQPNSNAMIFEQVNGLIKIAVELLEQLKTKDTHQETMKHGCIWTLKGWWENNLKHLQRAIK